MSGQPVKVSMDLSAGRFATTQPPDSFIVIAPNIGTTILMDADHRVECLSIPYRPLLGWDASGEEFPRDADFGPLHRSFVVDRDVQRAVRAIAAESRSGTPSGKLYADGLVLQAVSRLAVLSRRQRDAMCRQSDWRVQRAKAYLADNLASDVDMLALCNEIGVSASHLHALFRSGAGTTPHQWRLQRRIDRACDLLRTTSLSITEIANQCGFSSSQHFAFTFLRMRGARPSAFRSGSS